MITNKPQIATFAEAAGVAFVMVDIEFNGKVERQAHAATPVNRHAIADLKLLRPVLRSSKLMLRLNPLYEGTSREVDEALDAGVDYFMLPFFKTADEIARYREIVRDRAPKALRAARRAGVPSSGSHGAEVRHLLSRTPG